MIGRGPRTEPRRRILAPVRRAFALLVLVAAGCGPAPSPVDPKPGPTQPVATTVPVEDDPRIVRCGVDDRPRSVVGAAETPRSPFLGAPPVVASRAPPPLFVPPSEGELVEAPPEPQPTITLTRTAARALPDRPASGLDALATQNPQYEVCAELVRREDAGLHEHTVEFGAAGLPLRVVADATPSRLARCLMERSCQLRAPGRLDVRLGVQAARTEPPVKPPVDPPKPAADDVRVTFEGETGRSATKVLGDVVRGCAGTAQRPLEVTIEVTQTLRVDPNTHLPMLQGAPARPSRPTFTTRARVRSTLDPPARRCIERSFAQRREDLGAPFVARVLLR